MAVYKVPQDVEAEDKLLGPFSFRQFIYLIVAALGILMAWLLSRIFIGLLILPLPIVVAFLALALPLRKDQPMETYLVAMIKFFFKPRRRLWDPEGTISLVTITAPQVAEGPQLRGWSRDDASSRFAYLSQVVDTQGWATRGALGANQNLSDIIIAEASQATDILDETSGVAQSLGQRITQADDARIAAARERMQAMTVAQSQPVPAPVPQPVAQAPAAMQPAASTATDTTPEPAVHFDPYPSAMRQHVIQPTSTPAVPQPIATPTPAPVTEPSVSTTEKQPSAETVSPDIMRLANNNDLSISAIAHEAHRLEEKQDDGEVVISLR